VSADTCPNCNGEGWVCENHQSQPWNEDPGGCQCGAGAPCRICNPCTRDFPPRMPPGFTEIDCD